MVEVQMLEGGCFSSSGESRKKISNTGSSRWDTSPQRGGEFRGKFSSEKGVCEEEEGDFKTGTSFKPRGEGYSCVTVLGLVRDKDCQVM